MKPAIFIDAYLNTPEHEAVFQRNVQNFIDAGYDLFIISNKIHTFDKFDKVKYFEYDSRNRLLKDRSGYLASSDSDYFHFSKDYIFSHNNQKHTMHTCSPIFNTTNLSVLYNTRRICEIAKEFGYTNILRVDYDCIFSSYDLENTLLNGYKTEDWNNYGLAAWGCFGLYINFIYLNIDYFLSKIPLIKSDYQYKEFISDSFGELKYLTFEKIIAWKLNKLRILNKDDTNLYVVNTTNIFTSVENTNRYNFYSGNLLVVTMNEHTCLLLDNEYSEPVSVTIEYNDVVDIITLQPRYFYFKDIEPGKKLCIKHNNLVKSIDTTTSCVSTFTKC